MLSEGSHWGINNMIYGDNPKDPLGLNRYTPDIRAIRQSSNLYVYCGNNPIMYKDSTGLVWETVFDIASTLWSAYDLVTDPSWANAGWLALDIGGLIIPFVPSTGQIAKAGVKVAGKADGIKIIGKFDSIADAAKAAGVKIPKYQQEIISSKVYIGQGNKLTQAMKDAYRYEATNVLMKSKMEVARKAGIQVNSVHHIRPLEYAHLFPGMDPNAMSNLAGVSSQVHSQINGIWNAFRSKYPNPTAQQVTNQINAINKQFGSLFVK